MPATRGEPHPPRMVTTRLSGTIVMPGRLEPCVKRLGAGMETVRYAVRVRGRTCDGATAASQEGLDVTIDPVRTVLRGRLPDQAALFGVLSMIRLCGLELIEVRRRPQADSQ
jgi:hypothetical protein